jgi:SecD/SecF fusion protein
LFRIRTTEADVDEVAHRVTDSMEAEGFHLKQIEMTPKPAEINKSIQTIALADLPPGDEGKKLDRFADGYRLSATFPEGVTQSELQTKFTEAMNGIGDEGQPRYAQLDKLVHYSYPKSASPSSGDTINQAEIWVTDDISKADFELALNTLQEPQFEGKNSFASSVAGEMKVSAVQAILVSLIAIVAYLWFRFQRITFGLAAVVAVVHDVLAVLGIMAMVSYAASAWGISFLQLEDFKINLPMIAAFLTLVGYSLNDTIVVFYRIREVRGKNPALTVQMIDTSLNQTLSRTILTSFTTWIVVAILYFIVGAGFHGFAFCLVMGIIVGTYSSIYVASPVLLWLMNRESKNTRAQQTTQPTKAAAAG